MSDVTSAPSSADDADKFAVLTFRRREFRVRAGQTVRQAIVQCGLQPEEVLVTRNGELIEDDVLLQTGDRVKLLPTISGG
jgi:sulfur carrier protein ThiS